MIKQTLFITVLFISTLSFSQTEKKVLFLGNSYTSSNDLPKLVANLAQADGNSLNYQSYSPGGKQLNQHVQDQTSLNLIASENWNFVVLQEQSQIPSFPDSQVEELFYPAAQFLTEKIRDNNACSIPLFFNTWGRQNGINQWVGIDTFEKMNSRLFNAYTQATNINYSMMSPIGVGFSHIKNDPAAVVDFNNLYNPDGSHPSIHGSYLAACVFNNIIFSTTSIGNTYVPAGVSGTQASYLQTVADWVVYEVDSVRIDFYSLLNLEFTYEQTENTISVSPIISGGKFASWSFGDGTISEEEFATHTYEVIGSYDVQLITTNECETDTVTQVVTAAFLGLSDESKSTFKVYPNPSLDGKVFVENNGSIYSVYTVLGEEIYTGNSDNIQLAKGVYLFQQNEMLKKLIVH